jgi:hypothetical protein
MRWPAPPDACGAGERIEAGAEFIVAVANQEPWRRTKRRRVAKLLRHPRLRGAACRRGEPDFAGSELDEDKREDRAEEHVVGLQEVARPDLTGVVSEESRPPLPSRRALAHGPHGLLDRTLADADAELEQLSADPLRALESVRRGHGPGQC